ncbi:MAG: hypothetical protein ACMG51_00500 [Ginsengibacter sp.]
MLFPDQSWRSGMQDVSIAIDQSMGELVTVTPANVQRPNFPSVPDSSRAVAVTAVFMRKAKTVLMGNEHRLSGHSLSPLVETSEPIFSFSLDALPFPILQSYRITRLCSGEVFEVTKPESDGVSRINCKVVQLGKDAS